jgi:glycosyltransferase involved in cell wall biosynthesis
MRRWQIITGEYATGGVGDYTRNVASALARVGDEVHVWVPNSADGIREDPGVLVHALPGRFGAPALLILDRAILAAPDSRILIQYVPHAFGLKAMNLPFCCWARARLHDRILVMFHEVAFKATSRAFGHNVLEVMTNIMAKLLARAASRIFVSTSSWEQMLQPMLRRDVPIEVLPIPSPVEVVNDAEAIRAIRQKYARNDDFLVGHFSAHPRNIQPYLAPVIHALLADQRVRVMLIGKGSCDFKQTLAPRCNDTGPRLHATGEIGSCEVSLHLSACDLMIQPYPDGITTRRSSAMAAIAHRRPVVTTRGNHTEAIWRDSAAVSLVPADDLRRLVSSTFDLLDDSRERQRLSLAGGNLYRDRFDLRHIIKTMRRQ